MPPVKVHDALILMPVEEVPEMIDLEWILRTICEKWKNSTEQPPGEPYKTSIRF